MTITAPPHPPVPVHSIACYIYTACTELAELTMSSMTAGHWRNWSCWTEAALLDRSVRDPEVYLLVVALETLHRLSDREHELLVDDLLGAVDDLLEIWIRFQDVLLYLLDTEL